MPVVGQYSLKAKILTPPPSPTPAAGLDSRNDFTPVVCRLTRIYVDTHKVPMGFT